MLTYLTLKEAAKYLGLSCSLLQKKAKNGEIPCRKIAGGEKWSKYKFVREKLDEFMTQEIPQKKESELKGDLL